MNSSAACEAAKIASIERRTALFLRTIQGMGVKPFLVLEKGAKRQGDLPVLVAFRARRECPRITQDVAPVLDQLCPAVERTILHQCASNRRHDCHPCRLSVTAMLVTAQIWHQRSGVAGQYCSLP